MITSTPAARASAHARNGAYATVQHRSTATTSNAPFHHRELATVLMRSPVLFRPDARHGLPCQNRSLKNAADTTSYSTEPALPQTTRRNPARAVSARKRTAFISPRQSHGAAGVAYRPALDTTIPKSARAPADHDGEGPDEPRPHIAPHRTAAATCRKTGVPDIPDTPNLAKTREPSLDRVIQPTRGAT